MVVAAFAALIPNGTANNQRAVADEAARHAAMVRADYAAQLARSVPAPPETLGLPLLRLARAPEVLARQQLWAAAPGVIDPLVAEWPDTSCVSVNFAGRELYATQNQQPLTIASVAKLFTAAAVVEHFALDARLTTSVVALNQPSADGALTGEVWLVGGGDPLLATQAYAESFSRQPQLWTSFEALADSVVAAGVTSISGRLLADETRFPVARRVDTWPDRYDSQALVGRLSALTVNDGRETFSSHVRLAPEPALWAATVLRDLLVVRGIDVDVAIAQGTAPPTATEIARVHSPTIEDMVSQMLRESDNNTAEMLLRELGRAERGAATTPAGIDVVSSVVASLTSGTPPTIADGSGLDPTNTATCAQLVELLESIGSHSVIAGGLPIAAETGTLAHRFASSEASGKLRAKTGLLAGVNALAGFIDTDNGTITFAQLLNGVQTDDRSGFEAQEHLVESLLNLVTTSYAEPLSRIAEFANRA